MRIVNEPKEQDFQLDVNGRWDFRFLMHFSFMFSFQIEALVMSEHSNDPLLGYGGQ